MKRFKFSGLMVAFFGSSMIFFNTSCSEINDVGPQSTLIEDPMQTETISGIFPVEVYVPGVYVTQAADKVGGCEEKSGNTCMIIRCNNKSGNSNPIGTVLLPNDNSFDNPLEKAADILEVNYEPTTLTQNELTNVFVRNSDGTASINGIAIKGK